MIRSGRIALQFATGLLIVLVAACGSPGLPFQVNMREARTDVTYGRQGQDEAAPRPPGAETDVTTFPGFIAAPVPMVPEARSRTPGGAGDGDRMGAVDRCPTPSPLAVPERPASPTVGRPPREGTYLFRRDGTVRSAPAEQGSSGIEEAEAERLPETVRRAVENVEEIHSGGEPQYVFDIVQEEGELRTTTTYVIDNGSGIYIRRIVTERPDLPGRPGTAQGVESFNPQPPIRIMNLPAVHEPLEPGYLTPDQYSSGVDPLTGISMEVFFRTVERTRVDACGERLDAWRVTFQGEFHRPGVREFTFRGEFAVATQFGGLIVRDDVTLEGRDAPRGVAFRQEGVTTIDASRPEGA